MGKWDFERTIIYKPETPPTALTPWAGPATQTPPPATWGTRDIPAGRVDTLTAGVLVPMLQGLGQGVFPGLLVGTVAGVTTTALDGPWWVGPLTGFVMLAGVASWRCWLFIDGRQEALWQREVLSRRDIDGDGHVGKPDPVTVKVEVEDIGGGKTRFVDLAVDPAKLRILARGLTGGRPFSEPEWVGKGKPFSRRQFYALRSELLNRGLLVQRHPTEPKQGFELTPAGRAVFRRLTDLSPTAGAVIEGG